MSQHEDEQTLLDDLQSLVEDVGAWLSWTQLGGADVIPADGRLPRADRQQLVQALSAGLKGGSGPARPRAPVARPSSSSTSSSPPASGRFSAPRAPGQSTPGRVSPPAAAERPTRTSTPSVPAPPAAASRQGSLGKWGRYLDGGKQTLPTVGALDAATSLAEVRTELGDCRRCGLCRGRRNIVFGVGAEKTPLMVIGEGPGANEDRRGEPFVGKAGQMLDRMLENVIGLPRSQVYITNVVKCRPPENRNPSPEEIARCRPFLLSQLRVVQPKVVLVLGSVACRAVFETQAGVTRLRGQWRSLRFPGGEARAMPTFHPAYLLRQPDEKRKTFADLKAVKEALAELA